MRRDENVFPDDLKRRPFITETCGLRVVGEADSFPYSVTGKTDVVGQSIEPNVGDEIFVEGEFDSPIESRLRTRDTKLAAQPFNGIAQFRLAKIGDDRVPAIIEIRQQPVFVLA